MSFPILVAEQLHHIRDALDLDTGIWRNMPDSFIILAFQGTRISKLKERYPWADRENLEFLGDSILGWLVTKLMFQHPHVFQLTPGRATNIRSNLVKNATLKCFLDKLSLCQYTFTTSNKSCADTFEALIGVMYMWLQQNSSSVDLQQIERWLLETLDFQSMLDIAYEQPGIDLCPYIEAKSHMVSIHPMEALSDSISDSNDELDLILAPESMLVTEPRVIDKIKAYETMFERGIPKRYTSPERWDEAISLAWQLRLLPINDVSKLYGKKILTQVSKLLHEEREAISDILQVSAIDIPGFYGTLREKTIQILQDILQRKLYTVPAVLHLGKFLGYYPKLPIISMKTPGDFIQELLTLVLY